MAHISSRTVSAYVIPPAQQAVEGEFSHPGIRLNDPKVAEERMALNLYGDRFGVPDRDAYHEPELTPEDRIRAQRNLQISLANYRGFGILSR